MQTFTVCNQPFTLRITVQSIGHVIESHDVNLLDISANDWALIAELERRPDRLGAILWTLLYKQAENYNITRDQFLGDLAGDVLGGAQIALWKAVIDFFPDPAQRRTLATFFDKVLEAQRAMCQMALEKIIEAPTAPPSGNSVGTAPELSACNLDPGPSEN